MSGVHPEPGAGAVCVRAAGTARGVGLRCLDWGARGSLKHSIGLNRDSRGCNTAHNNTTTQPNTTTLQHNDTTTQRNTTTQQHNNTTASTPTQPNGESHSIASYVVRGRWE